MKKPPLIILVTLILISCQPAPLSEIPAATIALTPEATTTVTRQTFQEFVVGFTGEIDPAWLWLPQVSEPFSPLDLAFEGLLTLSPEWTLKPKIARFEISPEATVVTFTLHTNVFWHSGKPLTAFDAATFIELAFSPGHRGPLSSKSSLLQKIKVHDDRTFTVELNEPDCSLITEIGLLKLTHPPSFPSMPPVEELSGTGLFRIIHWGEDEILLEKSRVSGAETLPVERLCFRRFSSGEEVLEAFRTGEIKAFILEPGETILPKDLRAERLLSSKLYFLAFNLRDQILKDLRVRQALTMAVPREELLREVLSGEGLMARSPFFPGYLPEEPRLPPFSPERALELLKESGWVDENGDGILEKDGKPLRLRILTNGENQVREKIALIVARYYRAIGIDAEVNVVEWGNFLEALFEGYFQVAVFSISLGPDPNPSPFFSAGGIFNFSGFSDQEAERLLKEGLRASRCDPEIRRKVYSQLASRLDELKPWDLLFFPYTLVGPEELFRAIYAAF